MRRFLAILVGLAATALLCGELAAHDLPTERKLVADVGPSSVEMMLVYQHPKSDAVMLLFRKYDVDGDGELTGAEAKLAGREWMPRVLHGLQFEVAGERPRPHEPEIKFRREDDGALSAAVYMKWSVDELAPGQERTFQVRVLEKKGATKTLVDLRSGGPLVVDSFAAKGARADTAVKVMLSVGEEATLKLRRPESPETSP